MKRNQNAEKDVEDSLLKNQLTRLRDTFRTRATTIILSAFGFLAAFAWRDAIREAFDIWMPMGGGLEWKFLYAIIVTLLLVFVAYFMSFIEKKK